MMEIIKNKEEVKSVMNIIQAFADGKTIQAIDPYEDDRKVVVCHYMTAEEYMQFMVHDVIEGHLSTAEIADKYCDCASLELRDSLITQLEELRRLYNYKEILSK